VSFNPQQIERLLGRRIIYAGTVCQIIEVLGEGPCLVLQDCGHQSVIQADQFGDARRWVPRIFTVALYNLRRDGLNPALADLTKFLT
jgi:hypothetical protein